MPPRVSNSSDSESHSNSDSDYDSTLKSPQKKHKNKNKKEKEKEKKKSKPEPEEEKEEEEEEEETIEVDESELSLVTYQAMGQSMEFLQKFQIQMDQQFQNQSLIQKKNTEILNQLMQQLDLFESKLNLVMDSLESLKTNQMKKEEEKDKATFPEISFSIPTSETSIRTFSSHLLKKQEEEEKKRNPPEKIKEEKDSDDLVFGESE